MDKLIGSLCLVGLMIASVAILSVATPQRSSCFNEDEIEVYDFTGKSDEYKTKLALSYVAKLNKKRSLLKSQKKKSKSVEEALRNLYNIKETGMELSKLGVSEDWIKLSNMRQEINRCENSFISELKMSASTFENEPLKYEYLHCWFQYYLEKCDHNQRFKQVTKWIGSEHAASINKHETLYDYMMDEFLKQMATRSHELPEFLELIEELSKFDSARKETYCTNAQLKASLLDWLDKSQMYFPQLIDLMEAYLGLYLEKCGHEERYKKVLAQCKVETDDNSKTHAGVLLGDKRFHGPTYKISPILDIVDKLAGLRAIDEWKCKPGSSKFFLDIRCEAEKYAPKLVKCVDNIFADYVEVCTSNFKAMEDRFKTENTRAWRLIQKYADLAATEMNQFDVKTRKSPNSMIEAFEEVLKRFEEAIWDGTDTNEFGITKFRPEIHASCRVLRQYMRPSLSIMAHDFGPAKQDQRIMALMKYLGFCQAYLWGKDEIQALFQHLGGLFFATLDHEQKSSFKLGRCPPFRRQED